MNPPTVGVVKKGTIAETAVHSEHAEVADKIEAEKKPVIVEEPEITEKIVIEEKEEVTEKSNVEEKPEVSEKSTVAEKSEVTAEVSKGEKGKVIEKKEDSAKAQVESTTVDKSVAVKSDEETSKVPVGDDKKIVVEGVQNDEPVDNVSIREKQVAKEPGDKETDMKPVKEESAVQTDAQVLEESVDQSRVEESTTDMPEVQEKSVDAAEVTEVSIVLEEHEASENERLADDESAGLDDTVDDVKVEESTTQNPSSDEPSIAEIQRDTVVTEVPSEQLVIDGTDVVTETEEPSSAYFRNEGIIVDEATEVGELTTTDKAIDSTTVSINDLTTELAIDGSNTDAPEKIDALRETHADPSDVTVLEVDESHTSEISVREGDEIQEVTTETPLETVNEQKVDQMFEDAAPISIVEIQQDTVKEDAEIPDNSAQIEVVEIIEPPKPVAKENEVAKVGDSVSVPSVLESEVEVKTDHLEKESDKVKSPEIDGSPKDNKPSISKTQASEVDDEYWLKMQQSPVTENSPSPAALETAEINVTESKKEIVPETITPDNSSDSEDKPIKSKIPIAVPSADSEMGKESGSKVEVIKEDPIYQGSESIDNFQDSNDLQRRMSFGDKVVRFVRSRW